MKCSWQHARPRGCCAVAPEARKQGALLIDGGHLEAAYRKIGRPDNPMPALLEAIERIYNATITRKELHQGTEDGKPTEQHRCYKSPDGGKLDIILYGMKDQVGRSSRPHLRGCRTTIRVESGVDVGLGVAMQEMPSSRDEPYSVVIVITGDGDLERAFKRSPHTVYVCSLKASTSSSLEPYVKLAPDGRRIYLEDVMMEAYRGLPRMNFGTMAGGEGADGAYGGGVPRKEPRLTKCFAGRICEKLKDPEHTSMYRHPCPDGPSCPLIYEDPESEQRKRHLMQYGHICSRPDCDFDDEMHLAVCEHPRKGKPLCPTEHCTQVWNREHAWQFRHRCPDDRKCALMKRVQTDAQKVDHMRCYMHTCSFGKACLYIRDPEWNWEHMLQFNHPRRSCTEVAGVASFCRGASFNTVCGETVTSDNSEVEAVTQLPHSEPAQAEAAGGCADEAMSRVAPLQKGVVPRPYAGPQNEAREGGYCPPRVVEMDRGVKRPKEVGEHGEDELASLSGSISSLSVASGVTDTTAASSIVGDSIGKGEGGRVTLPEDGPILCCRDGCAVVGLWPESLCRAHGGERCRWGMVGMPCTKDVYDTGIKHGLALCKQHLLDTEVLDRRVAEFFKTDRELRGRSFSELDAVGKKAMRRRYLTQKFNR